MIWSRRLGRAAHNARHPLTHVEKAKTPCSLAGTEILERWASVTPLLGSVPLACGIRLAENDP